MVDVQTSGADMPRRGVAAFFLGREGPIRIKSAIFRGTAAFLLLIILYEFYASAFPNGDVLIFGNVDVEITTYDGSKGPTLSVPRAYFGQGILGAVRSISSSGKQNAISLRAAYPSMRPASFFPNEKAITFSILQSDGGFIDRWVSHSLFGMVETYDTEMKLKKYSNISDIKNKSKIVRSYYYKKYENKNISVKLQCISDHPKSLCRINSDYTTYSENSVGFSFLFPKPDKYEWESYLSKVRELFDSLTVAERAKLSGS